MTRHIFSEKISFIYFKMHVQVMFQNEVHSQYFYVQTGYIIYIFTVEIHTMFNFLKSKCLTLSVTRRCLHEKVNPIFSALFVRDECYQLSECILVGIPLMATNLVILLVIAHCLQVNSSNLMTSKNEYEDFGSYNSFSTLFRVTFWATSYGRNLIRTI